MKSEELRVELIYDADCPNAAEARVRLREVMTTLGHLQKWQEWDRGDSGSPSYALEYGSPTILVNGKDVAGIEPSGEVSSCRLYQDSSGGFQGAPPTEMIEAALAGC